MSEKWILNPCEKINGINFGEDREEVRKKLNSEFTEFKKTKYSKNTTDDYGCFHVFYDDNNKMEAIEFFENVDIYVGDSQIFPAKAEDVKSIFEDATIDENELISVKYSIGGTIENNMIVSILVGCKDYYL